MKIPLVVIIGRPNVGKSTLFNRLTKSNLAIVEDFSGVTRDRLHGDVDWNGKIFQLIDTGGYVPKSADLFESAIREQVEIAVKEADAVFFMTDGRAGLTPSDAEIAGMLRVSNKPVFVLVNKSDNVEQGFSKAEFYKLGLSDVYDISALSGRNLGDVLDELITRIDFSEGEYEADERLKIAIVGKPNVGKSSLTNALLGYDRSIVTNIPGTTRDSVNSILKYYGEEFVLVDTAGLRKKARITENLEFYSSVRTYRAIAESDVCIILVDAVEGLGNQDQKIIQEAVQRRKGMILAVNKWDLIEKDTNTARKFELELRQTLGSVDYIPIIFISALNKQRIYKLIEMAKKIEAERKKQIPPDELTETLREEIEKTPPPTTPNGKEIRIKFINQVGSKYPVFLLFANDIKYIPDSYRRFIEKLIRRKYGFEGVAITVSFKEK